MSRDALASMSEVRAVMRSPASGQDGASGQGTQVAGGQAPSIATDAPVPGAGSTGGPSSAAGAGTMVLPAAGGGAAAGGEGSSVVGAVGRGAAWTVEGVGAGTLALAGGFLMLMTTSTAKTIQSG